MNEHTQAYMVEVIKKFLDGGFDGDKWNYEIHNEIAFIGGVGGLKGKISDLKFYIIVGDENVTCYHIAPVKAPVEQRAAVSEFITRANYGLTKGNFEMDFNDGELRYKTTISQHDLLRNDTAAFRSMRILMMLGPTIWRRYGNNLVALLFGFSADKSVEELVEQCKNAE